MWGLPGLRDAPVAGRATVRAGEPRSHRRPVAEVSASIDGGGEDRREVAEAEMELVVETKAPGRRRLRSREAGMGRLVAA